MTSDRAEIIYKCTDYYVPEYEKSLLWNDPALNIEWPITVEPVLSKKDSEGSILLSNIEVFDDDY